MTARIYQPAKNAMQSGKGKSGVWVLEFEPEKPRSADPLTGWTSSSDMKQEIHLKFDSKQAAIDYAEREGLAYQVIKAHKPRVPHKSYADNFRFGRHANWTH
ncbi:MAG TPA: ETC complex I subunit [Rhizobiales bacterium]|nr:ETC complex I subunit [Hyphomicrobiales bacterium]